MLSTDNIKITINFSDPDLDPEDRDVLAHNLTQELRDLDEVNSVKRVLDTHAPQGNKSLGGFLVGLLTAEVSAKNAKQVLVFLGNRLGSKPIELEVEANNGKSLKVKAYSREDLAVAVKAAQDFISGEYKEE